MTDQLRAAAQALIDVHDRHHIIFPYTSAANMRGIIAKIAALRTALAADAEQCEWTGDQDNFFTMSCDANGFQQSPFDYDPSDYMTYCCYCGKRIKFLESEE